jgi:hypothetical protein
MTAALTLIEVTLVVAVLMALIGTLFIGAASYSEGSSRARCLLNLSNVQKAVRSYQNFYDLAPGSALASTAIIGTGKLIETAPACGSGGTYTYGTTIPATGTAYMSCSLAATRSHVAANLAGW